jgi:hypothetical protein
MEGHEEQAERLERELEDMERQSDRLGDEIDEAGEDWQRKKQDSSVPGAGGADVVEGEEPDDDEDES